MTVFRYLLRGDIEGGQRNALPMFVSEPLVLDMCPFLAESKMPTTRT